MIQPLDKMKVNVTLKSDTANLDLLSRMVDQLYLEETGLEIYDLIG